MLQFMEHIHLISIKKLLANFNVRNVCLKTLPTLILLCEKYVYLKYNVVSRLSFCLS